MKRVIVFLFIAGLSTMFASGQRREDRSSSGLKSEVRSVSGFSGIDASSVFNITVAKGNSESLTIEADEAIMQYVRSEVRNGVLHLYLDRGAERTTRNIRTLKAFVVMRDLESVSLSGASSLTANDLFSPRQFTGECSGASSIAVNVNTNSLKIEASGTGKIHLKANVVGDAALNVSGSSKIQGDLKANNVNFSSSGVGIVELTGAANDIVIQISGTARIRAENFVVKKATINSSGTGNVRINVTDAMTVNSSGASSITYKGSPSVTLNVSRASRVQQI